MRFKTIKVGDVSFSTLLVYKDRQEFSEIRFILEEEQGRVEYLRFAKKRLSFGRELHAEDPSKYHVYPAHTMRAKEG